MRHVPAIALGLVALVTFAAVAALTAGTRASTAAFTTTSQSTLEASAAHVRGWLNLYSQSTDPWGDTGYATQVGTPLPAATGQDDGIDVYFQIPSNGTRTHARVVKVRTPAAFPDPGVTAVTVTVTVTPDAATGTQPIKSFGVDVWGAAPTYTKTITNWGSNVQRQLNLETKFPGNSIPPGDYTPEVIITVKYTGFTRDYYQYTIPIRIRYR